MEHIRNMIIVLALGLAVSSYAQPQRAVSDTISLGYGIDIPSKTDSRFAAGVDSNAFEYANYADVSKALYGKIAGLNVYQGSGSSADNISTLQLHGHTPLVLVDGFPRSIEYLTSQEIESAYILTDAASAALYGVRGGNGILFR